MTSLANIDPSLRDMSYAVNLTTNLSTSQDGHGADGNSILGGEPVRRSGFVPQPSGFLMPLHFQLSPL